jgi:AbrB family looped-hinge helix DNA binding protein
METAYVTTKGRLVIPVRIRRKLGIKPGTKVCFVERGREILFQPITKTYIRSLCGMLKSRTSVTQELLRERRKDGSSEFSCAVEPTRVR